MRSLHRHSEELGPEDQPNTELHDLLVQLTELLRKRADPLLSHHPVEALAERVAAMGRQDRDCLEEVTKQQRTYLQGMISANLESPLDDLPLGLRTVEALTDAVISWQGDARSCIELFDLQYSDCDLSELVYEACNAFRSLAAERNIELRVQSDRGVRAELDADKVYRVVLNLLFNAFKVTPIDGVVQLSLDADHRLREATIRILDSGPGVPSQTAPSIFQRDLRSDRSAEITVGWLGLDLCTSRDFMRIQGGDLRLVPRGRERGAEFRATLPLEAPPHTTVDTSAVIDLAFAERVARTATEELQIEGRLGALAHVRDGADRPLVLLVEDSRAMQRMLVDALEATCTTASAFDGATGLRLAIELCPDLIITDLILPEMDGSSMLRAIRHQPTLSDTPVLVVSGSMGAGDTVELLRSGAQDVLRKPMLVPELQARVHNLLEAKRARDILSQLVGQRETDLGRLASEVDRHQKKLEAALAQLRIAREHAENASQVKSNFLRMMSHELKTPVTALLLQKQILTADPLLKSAPPHVARSFASISRSISRLLQIVDTMLEWARVESGRLSIQAKPFDLHELASEAASSLSDRAESRGVQIEVASRDLDPRPLVSDQSLVRLILLNILDRALSLTKDSRIQVRLEREGHEHRLVVCDGGPRLSAAEREELFDPFGTNLDLGRRGGTGSGLGLHVVRDLAEALRGNVSIPPSNDSESAVALTLVDLANAQQEER